MIQVRLSASDFFEWLYKNPTAPLAVDTETRGVDDPTLGLRVDDKRAICIGVSMTFRNAVGVLTSLYVPTNHVVGQNADEQTIKKMRYVLRQGRPLIFANCQFDMLSLETIGVRVSEMPFYDIQTMANLVREDWPMVKSLDALYSTYVPDGQHGKIDEWQHVEYEEYKSKGELKLRPVKTTTLEWQKKNGWPDTTPKMIDLYACRDTEATYEVWEVLIRHSRWKEQPADLWEHKQKLIRVLVEMKRRGIKVDIDLAAQLTVEGDAALEDLLDKLGGLNPRSVKDAPKIFLEKLELPVLKETPGGKPSFTRAVLEEYDLMLANREGPQPPEVEYVKAFRGWGTALGLLLRPYQELVSPDGRLRTSYTTHVTSTGRLSSRSPNLQQISKEAEGKPWKDRIKKCFVPKPGYRLLSADYSQLELRLAVAYAQEPALQEIFDEGRDIFTEMAAEMGWERSKTKSFVYATQYGGGDARISYIFNVPLAQAKKLREKFYRTYPRFRKLDMACRARVAETKKIKLWSGRIRHFRSSEESYKAMNALLQGGAADIVERVWVHVMETIDNEDCRTLLQVHDALVFEVREDLVEEYRVKIGEVMADINGIVAPDAAEPLFPVKFAVDVTDWWDEPTPPAVHEEPSEKLELIKAQEKINQLEHELFLSNYEEPGYGR